jgi:hypothetical protein
MRIPLPDRTRSLDCSPGVVEDFREIARRRLSLARDRMRAAGYEVRVSVLPSGLPCRTCDAHIGVVYDLDDAPQLPLHERCRCVLVPVIEEPGRTDAGEA